MIRQMPFHATALGKSLLLQLSEEDYISLMSRYELKPYTPHTIVDRDELFQEIQEARNRGWTEDIEEIEIGGFCLAVPIKMNGFLCSISVSGPLSRIGEEKRVEVIESIFKIKEKILLSLTNDT